MKKRQSALGTVAHLQSNSCDSCGNIFNNKQAEDIKFKNIITFKIAHLDTQTFRQKLGYLHFTDTFELGHHSCGGGSYLG